MPSSLLPATRDSSTPRDQPSEAALELHNRRPWEVGSQAEEPQLLLARDDRPSRLPIAHLTAGVVRTSAIPCSRKQLSDDG